MYKKKGMMLLIMSFSTLSAMSLERLRAELKEVEERADTYNSLCAVGQHATARKVRKELYEKLDFGQLIKEINDIESGAEITALIPDVLSQDTGEKLKVWHFYSGHLQRMNLHREAAALRELCYHIKKKRGELSIAQYCMHLSAAGKIGLVLGIAGTGMILYFFLKNYEKKSEK